MIKYVILIVAIIIGGCAGFYGAMKAIAKKNERRKQIDVSRLPNLTLFYVKDWIRVELNGQKNRTASVLLPGMLSPEDRANLEGIIPEELQADIEHLLLILVREHQETIKSRVIRFETMEDALTAELKKAGGVLNLQT